MKYFIFILTFLFSLSAFAQGGDIHIQGRVVDDSCQINTVNTKIEESINKEQFNAQLSRCKHVGYTKPYVEAVYTKTQATISHPNQKPTAMIYTLAYE